MKKPYELTEDDLIQDGECDYLHCSKCGQRCTEKKITYSNGQKAQMSFCIDCKNINPYKIIDADKALEHEQDYRLEMKSQPLNNEE